MGITDRCNDEGRETNCESTTGSEGGSNYNRISRSICCDSILPLLVEAFLYEEACSSDCSQRSYHDRTIHFEDETGEHHSSAEAATPTCCDDRFRFGEEAEDSDEHDEIAREEARSREISGAFSCSDDAAFSNRSGCGCGHLDHCDRIACRAVSSTEHLSPRRLASSPDRHRVRFLAHELW
jgi:hypothetical protein